MNVVAVIQQRIFPSTGAREWLAWLYDKDQPRIPESELLTAHFACVGMVGPHRRLDAVEAELNERGIPLYEGA